MNYLVDIRTFRGENVRTHGRPSSSAKPKGKPPMSELIFGEAPVEKDERNDDYCVECDCSPCECDEEDDDYEEDDGG